MEDVGRNIGIELIKIQTQWLVFKVCKTPVPFFLLNLSLIPSSAKPKLCLHLPASLLCLLPFLCFGQIGTLDEDHCFS